jgi:hypothetical protein
MQLNVKSALAPLAEPRRACRLAQRQAYLRQGGQTASLPRALSSESLAISRTGSRHEASRLCTGDLRAFRLAHKLPPDARRRSLVTLQCASSAERIDRFNFTCRPNQACDDDSLETQRFRIADIEWSRRYPSRHIEILNIGVATRTGTFLANRNTGSVGRSILNGDLAGGDQVHDAVGPDTRLSLTDLRRFHS